MLASKKNEPTYSPFEAINTTLCDPALTPGECKVMVSMIAFCGTAGRIFYSVRKFADRIAMSESRVRHILCDLVKRGYLIRNERPRLANEWVIPFAQEQHGMAEISVQHVADDTPILKNAYKEKTFNVVNSSESKTSEPKPKASLPFDMGLVREIEAVVGSCRDRGCWISIVRRVNSEIVRMAISSLRIKMTEETVHRPGAYLVNTIKAHCPEVFERKTSIVRPLPPVERIVTHAKPVVEPVSEPTTQDWDAGLAAIRRIRAQMGGGR